MAVAARLSGVGLLPYLRRPYADYAPQPIRVPGPPLAVLCTKAEVGERALLLVLAHLLQAISFGVFGSLRGDR